MIPLLTTTAVRLLLLFQLSFSGSISVSGGTSTPGTAVSALETLTSEQCAALDLEVDSGTCRPELELPGPGEALP